MLIVIGMIKTTLAVISAVVALGLSQAQAHLLNPIQFDVSLANYNSDTELAYLKSQNYVPATSEFLFKQNNDNTTEGNFGQYFTITVVDGNTWDVEWHLSGSGFTLDGVLIKDGSVDMGDTQHFRFYGVSSDETTDGSGTVEFVNPTRNISHVVFFGSPGNGVPDGGSTLMLLGAALSGLGFLRRFIG
jgi:hypothetical protein